MHNPFCCAGAVADVAPEEPALSIDELKALGPEERDDPMGTYFGEGDNVDEVYEQFGI